MIRDANDLPFFRDLTAAAIPATQELFDAARKPGYHGTLAYHAFHDALDAVGIVPPSRGTVNRWVASVQLNLVDRPTVTAEPPAVDEQATATAVEVVEEAPDLAGGVTTFQPLTALADIAESTGQAADVGEVIRRKPGRKPRFRIEAAPVSAQSAAAAAQAEPAPVQAGRVVTGLDMLGEVTKVMADVGYFIQGGSITLPSIPSDAAVVEQPAQVAPRSVAETVRERLLGVREQMIEETFERLSADIRREAVAIVDRAFATIGEVADR